MKQGNRAVALAAAALGCWALAGCGEAANEAGMARGEQSQATRPEAVPNFHTQAEYELWRSKQASQKKSPPAGQRRTRSGSTPSRR
jgi:hypothetical protein